MRHKCPCIRALLPPPCWSKVAFSSWTTPPRAEAIGSALRRAGYQTAEATEGSEALWRARSQRFDAILIDIHMPTMDGLEFIRQLRSLRGYDKAPVFVLTSDVTRAHLSEGRQLGATAWLIKPVNPASLVSAVREGLAPA